MTERKRNRPTEALERLHAVVKPGGDEMPPQIYERVRCRYCLAEKNSLGRKPTCIKTRRGRIDYRCWNCVDPETGDWTTFTVVLKRPQTPPEGPQE